MNYLYVMSILLGIAVLALSIAAFAINHILQKQGRSIEYLSRSLDGFRGMYDANYKLLCKERSDLELAHHNLKLIHEDNVNLRDAINRVYPILCARHNFKDHRTKWLMDPIASLSAVRFVIPHAPFDQCIADTKTQNKS